MNPKNPNQFVWLLLLAMAGLTTWSNMRAADALTKSRAATSPDGQVMSAPADPDYSLGIDLSGISKLIGFTLPPAGTLLTWGGLASVAWYFGGTWLKSLLTRQPLIVGPDGKTISQPLSLANLPDIAKLKSIIGDVMSVETFLGVLQQKGMPLTLDIKAVYLDGPLGLHLDLGQAPEPAPNA